MVAGDGLTFHHSVGMDNVRLYRTDDHEWGSGDRERLDGLCEVMDCDHGLKDDREWEGDCRELRDSVRDREFGDGDRYREQENGDRG